MFDISLSDQYVKFDYDIVRTNQPKNKQYFLDNAIGIYSIHLRDKGGISYESQCKYKYLREFGSGKQSEERYKDYFSTDQKKNSPINEAVSDVDGKGGFTQSPQGKRKGYMNIFWKVVSPASKIMATLLGKFEVAEYDIKANPIDSQSGSEVENKMLELWALKENLPFLREYFSNIGLAQQVPDYMPDTIEELKLFKDRGGFKSEASMFMEQLIRWTLYVSKWKEISRSNIADFINLGIAGTKDYYDKEDNTVKTRYSDPESGFIQYSKFNDFRDSEYAGEAIPKTISELRTILANEGIPEDIYEPNLAKVAKKYSGKYGNPNTEMWDKFSTPNEIGGWKYDFYKTMVLEVEWIDTDSYRDLLKTNKYGKDKLIQNVDLKTKEKDGQKINTTVVRKVFKCSWVIGTEMIYDYGIRANMTRENKKDVLLSYHYYKLPFSSITEQLIPIYDNFNIIWDKYQNNIATAINKGYAIDTDSLASLKAGDKNPEEESLRRFLETGVIFFKRKDVRGNIQSGSQLPIQELTGGMGSAVLDAHSQFELNFKLIENITGINPLSLGTVNPNAPVGTNEIAVAATSDTLRPILSGKLSIKEAVAKNTCYTIQLLLHDDLDAQKTYSEIIGKRGIEIMKISEGNAVKYGIALEAKPSEQQKRDLMDAAKVAEASGRNGQPGITLADYFAVTDILEYGGSLRLAEMILESSKRRNLASAQKIAQDNLAQQTQLQGQAAQVAEQAKTDGAVAVIKAKGVEDRETLITGAFLTALAAGDKAQADMQIKLIDNYVKTGQMYIPQQNEHLGQPTQPAQQPPIADPNQQAQQPEMAQPPV